MGTGVLKALKIIKKYGLDTFPGTRALCRIIRKKELLLGYHPFKGRIKGIYTRTPDGITLLTVRNGLPESELKHALACGLGYHLLCPDPGLYLLGFRDAKAESRVGAFAALLLVPPAAYAGKTAHPPAELARVGRIPDHAARLRTLLAVRYKV